MSLQEKKTSPSRLPKTAELCRFIREGINEAPPGIKGRPKWTRYVKSLFEKVAVQHGVVPYASGLKKASGEYLVDVCAAEEPGPHGQAFGYTQLVLAAECEWSPDWAQRSYDFAKLADIRSSRKVFVGAVQSRQWEQRESILSDMLGFLNRHKLVPKGEEYGVILCGYTKDQPIEAWILRKGVRTPSTVRR